MKQPVARLAVLVAMSCWACGGDAPLGSSSMRGTRSNTVRGMETTASESDQGGVDVFDAAPPLRNDSSHGRADAGNSGTGITSVDAAVAGRRARSQDMGAAGKASQAASGRDAGAQREDSEVSSRRNVPDASHEDAGRAGAAVDADASSMNTGGCCSTSAKPGCGDSQLQACVCMHRPSCCSDSWDESCTRVIAEKFCQSGVRECVCGNGAGQWQQAQCCATRWDDTCNSVATNKCSATQDCK